jgi:hypothetical protein
VIICIWFTVKGRVNIQTSCKSDTKCNVFCNWFVEWSNGMSPCVRTLAHGIEILMQDNKLHPHVYCKLYLRYILPDFKGKHTNHSTIYDTACVTSWLFRKSFNCRMDYAFCLLTLKSYEKWRSPLFGATCNFNDQILPYANTVYYF